MIISLFSRNEPGVRGTINTDGETPTATGVGVTMLEAWMKAHEGEPIGPTVRALESFYSSWGNQGAYSQVEPSGASRSLRAVEKDGAVTLLKLEKGAMQVREDGAWRDVAAGDNINGQAIAVTEEIVEQFDSGKINNADDAARYKG